MIDSIPAPNIPHWLRDIASNPAAAKFNLKDILKDSLYYPACGLNGTPVKFLVGNVHSFVYADYGVTQEVFLENLNGGRPECGFRGYESILQREIFHDDVVPPGWQPPMNPQDPASIELLGPRQEACRPFGHWSVWRTVGQGKKDEREDLFSFFYMGGEMSAIYQGLYSRNRIAPKILAVICPGFIGGEWEDVRGGDSFFHNVVDSNQAGMSEYLLTDEAAPCWEEYDKHCIATLPERDCHLWRRLG